MKGNRTIAKLSSLLQIILLCWLTVSTPFVYAAQQIKSGNPTHGIPGGDDNSNPLSGTQEEKHSNSISFNEEYLHTHEELHIAQDIKRLDACHHQDAYLAFHGEPHCPPPNIG